MKCFNANFYEAMLSVMSLDSKIVLMTFRDNNILANMFSMKLCCAEMLNDLIHTWVRISGDLVHL